MAKLVSIVIPNYNYGRYIRKSLESAVSQTYENIEIIVVDDASTDNSVEIIREYEKKYDNIKFYYNPKNLGVVGSHNRCVNLSSGEYLVVLSSDDYLHPDFISSCVQKLDAYPTAGIVSSDIWYVDDEDNVTSPESFYPESFFCKGIYQCKVWLFTNTFVPSQVLIRRSCLNDPDIGGMFSYLADTMIDTELWYRICLKYDFVYYRKKLSYYRHHIGSYSKSYENLKGYLQFYLARKRFGELAKDIPYLSNYTEEAVLRSTRMGTRYIRILLENGKFSLANQYLKLTEGLNPKIIEYPYYAYVEECVQKEYIPNARMLLEYEIEYNESCRAEEHKRMNTSQPYELPENVDVFKTI